MATSATPAEEAVPLSWYSQHGLGYGIDVTQDRPWRNKGPLIARQVTAESDVQMREEERALEEYHSEIVSGKDISLTVGMTLSTSESLVMMGIDAEIARSSTYAQFAVGSKIHTRTYDFAPSMSTEMTEFEERLRKYTGFGDEDDNNEVLRKRCKEFITENRCTHYIRGIKFGAVEYRVLTEESFSRIRNAGGDIGIRNKVAPSFSQRLKHFSFHRGMKSRSYTIGKCTKSDTGIEVDDHVIEWEVISIDTLVKSGDLKDELQAALEEYRKEKLQKRPIGPFHIKCGTKKNPLYLRRGSGNGVKVTEYRTRATMFSLSLDMVKDPTFFSIQLFSEEEATACLSCKHFYGGRSPPADPPLLSKTRKGVNVHMSLKDPFAGKGQSPPLPHEWITSGKWYAICCHHKHGLKSGSKFCVKKNDITQKLQLSAVPSMESHNEKKESYMLFSLESAPIDTFEHKPHKKEVNVDERTSISSGYSYNQGISITDNFDLKLSQRNMTKEANDFIL